MTESFLTDYDVHLLGEGRHYRAYEKLGAHPCQLNGVGGTHFAVVAPNADQVSLIGDFNNWDPDVDQLQPCGSSGIWQRFVPTARHGSLYKCRVRSRHGRHDADKADPYGFAAQLRPQTASKVWDLSTYTWSDASWMAERGRLNSHRAPISIYETHLGAWKRVPEEGARWLTYRELAPQLAEHLTSLGFTHLEILPIAEHPLDASWGYQTVGYYAPTSRFGTPDDFKFFVDTLHQAGIGVILDWVPAHFPSDPHGLAFFDGTHLYEHADPRQGRHPEWHTRIFNDGRGEVRNLLISNARFWLDEYHIDGLRADAVSSMLYLDYGRREGEWVPNETGGRENPDAIHFLQTLNEWVYRECPDVMMIAEESTAWPIVSRPTHLGGLGFGFKWNMGWMHDTLECMAQDPVHRRLHQDQLTFSLIYAFSENFILPLSHDEVVHGKASIVSKMPGDDWQRFANTRLLYGLMFGYPGKKLLFMGNEFGQRREWRFDESLDWHLLDDPLHRGLQRWVRDLNALYRAEPALYEMDGDATRFEWIDCSDHHSHVISFLRRGQDLDDSILYVYNFTPDVRDRYRIGITHAGRWNELLNSDATLYGGSGSGNLGGMEARPVRMHGRPYSLEMTLPALATMVFRRARG